MKNPKLLFLGFMLSILCVSLFSFSVATSAIGNETKAIRLIENIRDGQYADARADFDEKMAAQFSEAQMKQVWSQITMQVGKLENILETHTNAKVEMQEIIVVLKFEKTLLDAKVYCNHDGQITGFFLAPHEVKYDYVKPDYVISDNFTEQDITIGNETPLSGKLTLPKGSSKFPCIILVHGSGPNNMDEAIGPNKPFKDLAWGLSSRGVAVIRYNKRTYKNPNLDVENMTLKEEVLDDVAAAYNFAIAQENIDPKRVIILGHSLGGMCIPRIAGQLLDAGGFISMAGSLRSFAKIIPEQYNYIFGLDDEYSEEEERELSKINRQVKYTFSSSLDENFPADSLLLGVPAKYWLDYKAYDFVKGAKNISKPLLILQGDRDYQVTTEDFDYWKIVLKEKTNTTYELYPDLNHLFMTGAGMATPAEYEKVGHVDEKVIIDIVTWVLER